MSRCVDRKSTKTPLACPQALAFYDAQFKHNLKMHLKQKRRFFAAFLVCAAATLVVGFPQQQAAPKPRRRRGHTPNREGSTGPRASPGAAFSRFVHLDNLSDMDETRTGTSAEAGRGETPPSKARQSTKERVFTAPTPPAEDCVSGDIELARLGRFYISGRLEVNVLNGDYQAVTADSGRWFPPGACVSVFNIFFGLWTNFHIIFNHFSSASVSYSDKTNLMS